MIYKDNRPVCTKDNPKKEMKLKARHPDTKLINNPDNDDHGDEHHQCIHCGYSWWIEGPDY